MHMPSRVRIQDESAALLSIEAPLSSIFNIVFFFAFLKTRLGGILNLSEDLAFIIAKFSAGVLIGVAIGILWLCVLSFLRREEFMYIATIGYILKCYVIPSKT